MTSETETIRELEEKRYNAMIGGDLTALDTLLSDRLIYIHSDGCSDSKRNYMDGLASGNARYRGVERDGEKITICGDAAIVTTRLKIDYVARGAPRLIHSRALAVWSRHSGDWQLVALQSASASA